MATASLGGRSPRALRGRRCSTSSPSRRSASVRSSCVPTDTLRAGSTAIQRRRSLERSAGDVVLPSNPYAPRVSGFVIAEDDPRREDVRALLEQHLAFAREITPPEHVHALDVAELVDPAITFFTV